MLLLAARTVYVQWRNRQLSTERAQLQSESTQLKAKVEALSLRPPAVPVVLQLPDLIASSLRPSAASSAAAGSSNPPPDPDHFDLPPDEQDGS